MKQGVCCFDDASFSVIAKNLAGGDGYLLTLDYGNLDHSGTLFHPALGTGPTTIVFASAAIALFGAADWVPGVATVFFNLIVMLSMIAVMSKRVGLARALCFAAVLMLASIAVTQKHHEQWFALLGEVQSFLLTMLAYALIAFGSRSIRSLIAAGVMLGLAFLAKEMAILYTLPVAAVALATFFGSPTQPWTLRVQRSFTPLLAVALGAALPVIIFELYRLHALGLHGWMENWKLHIAFVRSQGVAQHAQSTYALIAERMDAFSIRFEFGFPATIALAVTGTFFALAMSRDNRTKTFALLVFVAWLLHASYWLLMSVGWARYAFLSIPFAIAAACVPILYAPLTGRSAIQWGLLAFLLAAIVQPTRHYISSIWHPSLSHSSDAADATQRSKVQLRDFLAGTDEVIYTPWWAHAASMEYLLPGHAHFTAVTSQSASGGLLLIDKKLPLPETSDFTELSARCRPLRSFGERYRVDRCSPSPDQ